MAKFRHGTFQVLTANDLLSGDVVFLTDEGTWSGNVDDARLARTPDEAAELDALAASAEVEAVTATAYTIEVERGPDGRLRPLRIRETIRITGPLVRPPSKLKGRKSAPRPVQTIEITVPVPRAGNGDDHVSL